MLEVLLGSHIKEKVLIFLYAREEGYAREISRFFETDLSPIQFQLQKLENNGILFSKFYGRTKVFRINPRYPFLLELKSLLKKALSYYPEKEKSELLLNRRRPRKSGKG